MNGSTRNPTLQKFCLVTSLGRDHRVAIQTYIHANRPCIHSITQIDMHTHKYIHAYIHTCIFIHTSIHVCNRWRSCAMDVFAVMSIASWWSSSSSAAQWVAGSEDAVWVVLRRHATSRSQL